MLLTDNDLSAVFFFAYNMNWSSLILIGVPLIKGAKCKRQGAESQNIQKLKTECY